MDVKKWWARLARITILAVMVLAGALSDAAAQTPNCSGATPNDSGDDGAAINYCLANQSTVILGSGYYWLEEGLVLNNDSVTFTGQTSARAPR